MDQDAGGRPEPGPGAAPGALPDTAMMSGSDEGGPGERLPDPPLTDDERAMLQALATHDQPVVDAVEDSVAAADAAQDDTPLPGTPTRRGDDPLDPVFRQPPD